MRTKTEDRGKWLQDNGFLRKYRHGVPVRETYWDGGTMQSRCLMNQRPGKFGAACEGEVGDYDHMSEAFRREHRENGVN